MQSVSDVQANVYQSNSVELGRWIVKHDCLLNSAFYNVNLIVTQYLQFYFELHTDQPS